MTVPRSDFFRQVLNGLLILFALIAVVRLFEATVDFLTNELNLKFPLLTGMLEGLKGFKGDLGWPLETRRSATGRLPASPVME